MEESRIIATRRMVEEGIKLLTDAIINGRYVSFAIMQGTSEVSGIWFSRKIFKKANCYNRKEFLC